MYFLHFSVHLELVRLVLRFLAGSLGGAMVLLWVLAYPRSRDPSSQQHRRRRACISWFLEVLVTTQ